MSNRKWAEPSASDPLSEPTLNRRLWAAYLSKGLTRRAFAQALGAGENVVSYWDVGKTTISLVYLIKAARIVEFSLDELVHGKQDTTSSAPAYPRSLSAEQVRELLDEASASYAQRDALSELMREQPAEPLSRAYVLAFLHGYSRACTEKTKHAVAMKRAQRAARNAHEQALAQAQGLQQLDYGVLRDTASGAVRAPRKRAKPLRKPRERLPTSTPEPKAR